MGFLMIFFLNYMTVILKNSCNEIMITGGAKVTQQKGKISQFEFTIHSLTK